MLERIVYVFQHFYLCLFCPTACFCLMVFAYYYPTSFLLIFDFYSLSFHLMYIKKR